LAHESLDAKGYPACCTTVLLQRCDTSLITPSDHLLQHIAVPVPDISIHTQCPSASRHLATLTVMQGTVCCHPAVRHPAASFSTLLCQHVVYKATCTTRMRGRPGPTLRPAGHAPMCVRPPQGTMTHHTHTLTAHSLWHSVKQKETANIPASIILPHSALRRLATVSATCWVSTSQAHHCALEEATPCAGDPNTDTPGSCPFPVYTRKVGLRVPTQLCWQAGTWYTAAAALSPVKKATQTHTATVPVVPSGKGPRRQPCAAPLNSCQQRQLLSFTHKHTSTRARILTN
jgi:hypothetical protein